MPKKSTVKIDESVLSKGQLRKLNAVRKSFGSEIADKAFAQWLTEQPREIAEPEDMNAALVRKTLEPMVMSNKLKIPRGGYIVRRGRGRIIVEPARSE
jgi:hypothetical protein